MPLAIPLKALLRLVPLLVLGMAARPLHFSPAPGSALTKCLSSDWSVHLDDLEIAINGDVWWRDFTMATELSQRIAVTDTYVALQGGQPILLDRRFNGLSQTMETFVGGSAEPHTWGSASGSSELEGTVVQFRWEEEDTYSKQFRDPDQRLEEELLGGLTEDMDLRVLLPAEYASIGDEWEIELTSLPDLLSPGGYVPWTIEFGETIGLLGDALDPALMGELRHVLSAMLEGHAKVKYLGEEDGHSQLGISLEIAATNRLDDLSELVTSIVHEFPDWGTVEVARLDLAFALQAEGTAEWDSERGHIYGLDLEGDFENALDLEVIWNVGSELLIEVRGSASGHFEQSFEAN